LLVYKSIDATIKIMTPIRKLGLLRGAGRLTIINLR